MVCALPTDQPRCVAVSSRQAPAAAPVGVDGLERPSGRTPRAWPLSIILSPPVSASTQVRPGSPRTPTVAREAGEEIPMR